MESGAPCFARLQVIDDPVPRSGPVNMAVDETLFGSLADGPVLRLYAWAQPTVSFGYFEPCATARAMAGGRAVVRRWTGGGIVEHGEDHTYSLIVPRACEFASLGSAESYRRVHTAVAATLARAGFFSESHGSDPVTGQAASGGNVCFERPVLHDLTHAGRKAAGAAQRRNRVGLLHQGSIRLPGADAAKWQRWEDHLRRELPLSLAGEWEPRSLSAEEIARAHELAATKYGTAPWTEKF